MNNLSVLKPSSFFLFFLLLHLHHHANAKLRYTPTDSILINCGSSGIVPSLNGLNWTGDFNSKFGPMETYNGKSVTAVARSQSSDVDAIPFMTARLSQFRFMYIFPVTAGQKFIRLYFYSTAYDGGFDRFKDFFDVKAGPYTLLRNFSASFYADNRKISSFIKEFCLNVEEGQQLNLTFSPVHVNSSDSYAFINGIEILSMPSNLYYTPPDESGVSFVGETEKFRVKKDTAMEKMYRFNVGGGALPPTEDTGMHRLWEVDLDYIDLNGLIGSDSSLSLNYSRIPNYTAPDDVYLSSRLTDTGYTNLTWKVTVDQGFKYIVRLHFCEFDLTVNISMRRFDIFLDNRTAQLGFDVIESSGGHLIPIYNDYIIAAGNKTGSGDDDHKLFITLKPSASSYDSFLNGMEIFKLNDSGGNLGGPNPLVSVPPQPSIAPVQPSRPTRKSNIKKTVIIAVSASVIGLLITVSLLALLIVWQLKKRKHDLHGSLYESLSCCWRMNSSKGQSTRTKASSLPEELCRHFSLAEIKAATRSFHESLIIGEGGFGKVYKAEIDDGAMVVAIKRLNPESRQGVKEFKSEIEMLSQLRHVHLVSLIGYCHEEGEMILVYDYMIKGTLRQHLYETEDDPLPWKKRLQICVGAARGLHYLHAGVRHTIIHRDIKTANILLDDNWTAKVSDFGLSKICAAADAAVSTMVKGTVGYLDPEYARRLQLTEKSDVYSFGVVLLEVLCARKPIDLKLKEEEWNLANWARKCIQNGTIHQIIDPHLIGKISRECFNKFVEITESCVRDNGINRPCMHDVMESLEFALELQETADAEKKEEGENVYPHASFHAPRYTNIVGAYNQLDANNYSIGSDDVDTDTSGFTHPSLESSSMMSSHGFSNTFNSAKK